MIDRRPAFIARCAGAADVIACVRCARDHEVLVAVRAETGLKLGEFDRETQAFGLATTQGVVPTVGMSGLTLGGGWGNLHAKYGLAIDNVISADVVTAERRLLTANALNPRGRSWSRAPTATTSPTRATRGSANPTVRATTASSR